MAHRQRRGAEVVEFALILPVFLTVVGGTMDFAWAYYHRSIITTAVNVGCRAGSLIDPGEDEADIDDVLTVANDAVLDSMAAGGLACDTDDNCTVSVSVAHDVPGRSLVCTANREVDSLFGIYDSYDISASIMVRLEWQR